VQGEGDRVVAVHQAQVPDQALARAGVPHETYLVPGADHGFDGNWTSLGTRMTRAKLAESPKRFV
jgi:hypothetical protein